MPNYNMLLKNKLLPDGRVISDYQIMTGKGLTDLDLAYIDEYGILEIAPRNQWSVPIGYYIDKDGNVSKQNYSDLIW